MLEIKNLHVEVDGKKILNGIDLTVNDGEVHAIMGPNGSGKSTLSYVLAGKDEYEVTDGEVLLNGENLLEMSPDERAVAGVFLAFQYPVEIPGVGTMTFLQDRAQRAAQGARRGGADDAGLHEAREGGLRQAADHAGHAAGGRSTSASPAARRSATRSSRWRFCSPRFA